MNLCKSPFLIMCYLASFKMNAAKVNSPSVRSTEERGGVSRALSHLKENGKIWLALTKTKKNAFYSTNEKI